MDIYRSLSGIVRYRCTSADMNGLLDEITRNNIPLFEINPVDQVTLEFTVSRKFCKNMETITKRRGERLTPINRKGLIWPLRSVCKRPVLIAGLLIILIVGILLPGRVLFINVEGNWEVPSRMILEAAENCGLSFGSVRRDIRSEHIKNSLLDAIPKLKWAGVNTYGCRAVITVRERDDQQPEGERSAVRHIVASRDGIITSCTVTDGFGLCSVGQAVQQGDILISGFTDCGITIRACAAKGEIFAITNRSLTVKTPLTLKSRTDFSREITKYSLLIGKKQINFHKGSGISGVGCVKMYSKYVLTLPGGFELPVSLVKVTITDCQLTERNVDDVSKLLESFSDDYLHEQMVNGTVIRKEETVTEADSAYLLTGNYICSESIGREQDEKIGDFHGETNGTDRQRGSGG